MARFMAIGRARRHERVERQLNQFNITELAQGGLLMHSTLRGALRHEG